MDRAHLIADKARETFLAIKKLRKETPQFTRVQRDSLELGVKKLQEAWWDEVGPLMVNGGVNTPPFTREKCEAFQNMNNQRSDEEDFNG